MRLGEARARVSDVSREPQILSRPARLWKINLSGDGWRQRKERRQKAESGGPLSTDDGAVA